MKRGRSEGGRDKRHLKKDRIVPPNARKSEASAGTYGVLPVLELLRADPDRVERVLIAEGTRDSRLHDVSELARSNGVIVVRVPREKLDASVPEGSRHQGVAAISAAAPYADADEVIQSAATPSLFVILDGVEDPRNLGAILRTAECAGVDGVFIPERRAVGLTETVAKTSAGAIEHIKVAKVGNVNRLIEELKSRNVWVVGTSAEAEMDHTEWDWTQNSALVLGGEGKGLHRLVAENCDALVRIPMYGRIESLNVSVAAGVVLFEAQRQRSLKLQEGK